MKRTDEAIGSCVANGSKVGSALLSWWRCFPFCLNFNCKFVIGYDLLEVFSQVFQLFFV